MSRNPFLSTFEAEFNKEAKRTDLIDMSATMNASPKKASFSNGSAAEELFVRPPFPCLLSVSMAAIRIGTSHAPGCVLRDRNQHPVSYRLSIAAVAQTGHGAFSVVCEHVR